MELRGVNGLGRLHILEFKTSLIINSQPIVLRHSLVALHLITTEEPQGRTRQGLALTGFRQLHKIAVCRRCWPRFIVIAHEVALMGTAFASLILTTIAAIGLAPVIVDVVLIFHKDIAVLVMIGGSVQTGTAIKVMCQQIMMERSGRTSPLTSIAAIAFLMTSIIESFMDYAPLNGSEVVVVDRHVLFATPSETAMINDDGIGILNTNRPAFDKVLVTTKSDASSKVSHNDILRPTQVQFSTTIKDSIAWSSLSCNGHMVQLGTNILFQRNDTTNAKYDGCMLTTCFRQCPAQGALATIVEVSHFHHLATSST